MNWAKKARKNNYYKQQHPHENLQLEGAHDARIAAQALMSMISRARGPG